MEPFLLSQLLIGIASVFDVMSFQFRNREGILVCLFISASLVGVHFFILENPTPGFLAIIAALRFLVANYRTGFRWMSFFMSANVAAFLLTYESPVNCLPFAGSTVGTWASFKQGDRSIRLAMLFAAILWLTHNILVKSPGAAILEGAFIISNLVGLYRFYWKNGRTTVQPLEIA